MFRHRMLQQQPEVIVEMVITFDQGEEFRQGMASLSQCNRIWMDLGILRGAECFSKGLRDSLDFSEGRKLRLLAMD